MNQEIILSSSLLDSFTNFRKHFLNMMLHIRFSLIYIFLSFTQNNINKVLILDKSLYHMRSFFMCFNEIDQNIIAYRKMIKQLATEEPTNIRHLRKTSEQIQPPIRNYKTLDNIPIFYMLRFIVHTSVSRFHQYND